MNEVVNGTVTYTSVCVVCKEEFENIKLEEEIDEVMPCCDKCISTFEY